MSGLLAFLLFGALFLVMCASDGERMSGTVATPIREKSKVTRQSPLPLTTLSMRESIPCAV